MSASEVEISRLPLASADPLRDRLEVIRALVPEAFVEGKLSPAKLAQCLGDGATACGPERYGLNWSGKSDAIRAMQALSVGTLLPCRSESLAFDTTENLIIEGDNLEVLKLLQRSYYGKVKLIYIDPPYNTGGEFIYPDNYAEGLQDYLKFSGQVSAGGVRLTTNTETDGRYHSKWLSMMYPRLFLARNLLREDGVIFVSIDDHEVHNLRLIMNEVFGEENFVAQVIWQKRSTPPNDKVLGANHDYIVCFARAAEVVKLLLRERTEEQLARYQNPDNHPKGPWAPGDLMANIKGGRFVESLYFPIRNPNTGEDHYPSSNGNWRFSRATIAQLIADDEIYFGDDGRGRPKLKRFLCDVKEGVTWPTIWDFPPLNTQGSSEMVEIFGSMTTFENPKPAGLMQEVLKVGSERNDLVLDFFAGSGTTAHAVLEQNKQDGGNRKFILVQLPEPTGREDFRTIADITKERVRRVIKKLIDAEAGKLPLGDSPPPDRGFKVFKLASSNFKIWDAVTTPAEAGALAEKLKQMVLNLEDGREDEAILYEVILKSGLPLTAQVEKLEVAGKTAWRVADGALAVCLDRALTQEALRAIIATKPKRVVCLDLGFAGNDALKTNTVLEMKSHGIEFATA